MCSLLVLCMFLGSAARSFSYVHGRHYHFLFIAALHIPRSAHNLFSHLLHSAWSASPSYPRGNTSWPAMWNLGSLWPCGAFDMWKGDRPTAGIPCAVSNVICSRHFNVCMYLWNKSNSNKFISSLHRVSLSETCLYLYLALHASLTISVHCRL